MKTARAKGKKPKRLDSGNVGITLANPVSEHFKAFIAGNAIAWEKMASEELRRRFPDARYGDETTLQEAIYEQGSETFMVTQDEAKGKTVAVCGAGPSLRQTAAQYCPKVDHIWGCNSALTWLHDHGHKPTHGFTIDQTPHMLAEWLDSPRVEYLTATSVHPHLIDYLRGKDYPVRLFHNYVGVKERPVMYDGRLMEYEDWMYAALFPATVRAGSGLNSVNRALDVATFMGYEKIYVLGADCALEVRAPKPDAPPGSPEHLAWLREHVTMHADGGDPLSSGATPMTMGGEIDGRMWESKPDMLISAVWLVRMARQHRDRIELVGDTLPNALIDKDDEFLGRMPTLVDNKGKPIGW